MYIKFLKGQWEDKLQYVYTSRFACTPQLTQEDDCIKNNTSTDMEDGFDYTSLLTKEMYGAGTKISAECSFEDFGAPLFVFTDKIWSDEAGKLRYSDCYEVVLYENGINVWKLTEAENKSVNAVKLLAARFRVESNKKHTFSVTFLEKAIEIDACGRSFLLHLDEIPEKYYVGITACENINRFYDFSVE